MFKKLLILALVLGLVSAAQAVITNPDDFESYTPTAAWVPTQSGQGWVMDTVDPDPGSTDNFSVKILDTGGQLGGNALEVSSADDGNGDNYWYAAVLAQGTTVLTADFKITEEGPTWGQGRIVLNLAEVSYGGNNMYFDTYGAGQCKLNAQSDDLETNVVVDIPGYDDAAALNVWYRLEMEIDWNAGLAKARLIDIDNAITHPWSDTVPAFDADDPGLNGVKINTNGVVVIDNVSLTGDVIDPEDFLFVDRTSQYGLSGISPSVRVTWADFNNNGWTDICDGRGQIWRNNDTFFMTFEVNGGLDGV